MSQSNSQGNARVVGPAAAAASGDVRFSPPLLDLTDRYTLPQKWRTWKQRWEAYSAISNLTAKPEEYQIGMLISCANDDTLTIVNALPYSNSGDRNKPSEVLKLLEEFCLAQENVMYERHTFYRRKQEEDESVESFITSIRTLARTCDFTENGVDFSEQMIRDRLVCGIKDDSVRQRLLAKNKPDLAACVKESRTTAATREQAQNMRITTRTNSLRVQEGETTPDTVLAMTPRTSDKSAGCEYCGKIHRWGQRYCPAYGQTCGSCGKMNHFATACKSRIRRGRRYEQRPRPRNPRGKINQVTDEVTQRPEEDQYEMEILTIWDDGPQAEEEIRKVHTTPCRQLFVVMKVSGSHTIKFQIDTGATCNLILKKELPKDAVIDYKSKKTLHFYNGANSFSLGTCKLRLTLPNGKEHWQSFQVVTDGPTSLLGAQSVQEMDLISINRESVSLADVHQLKDNQNRAGTTREELFKQYPSVFDREVGCLSGHLHLDIDKTVCPKHMPMRRIPTALREPLRDELKRLEALGVIEHVDGPTDWTSALVVVHKTNGALRICIDPHDLNPALKRNKHPVPTVDELLPDMTRAKVFTKCDVRSGFWHVQLDEESANLTTFSTPFGRYKWRRMPFGITPASEIFQKKLEQALEGLDGVRNIHDDIVIWGEGETWKEATENHDRRLHKLLERCEERGIALNKSEKKFILRTETLPYMGHIFSREGLKIDDNKVKAITAMPQPDNPQAIRRFLGMANFVSRFVPNMSKLSAPLRALTENGIEWTWSSTQTKAFEDVKKAIAEAATLKFFNPRQETVVQCDASSQGLGAVIMQNGQPVAFASRALSSAEVNYCQIEKELLAVVFALHRFDQYVYGRHISVESDHQPLQILVKKPLKDVPRRLQRMLLELQRYDYNLTYKKGELLFIADSLSRAYVEDKAFKYDATERVYRLTSEKEWEHINLAQETSGLSDERIRQIREHTRRDTNLQELQATIKTGWPMKAAEVKTCLRPCISTYEMSWLLKTMSSTEEQDASFQLPYARISWKSYTRCTWASQEHYAEHENLSTGRIWMPT